MPALYGGSLALPPACMCGAEAGPPRQLPQTASQQPCLPLRRSWRPALPQDPACAASLTRVAAQQASAGGEELFADFVGAVLNDLMYLLKDSLGVRFGFETGAMGHLGGPAGFARRQPEGAFGAGARGKLRAPGLSGEGRATTLSGSVPVWA